MKFVMSNCFLDFHWRKYQNETKSFGVLPLTELTVHFVCMHRVLLYFTWGMIPTCPTKIYLPWVFGYICQNNKVNILSVCEMIEVYNYTFGKRHIKNHVNSWNKHCQTFRSTWFYTITIITQVYYMYLCKYVQNATKTSLRINNFFV